MKKIGKHKYKNWEYSIHTSEINIKPDSNEDKRTSVFLNKLAGSEGWELVSTHVRPPDAWYENGATVHYFKRENPYED